MRMNPEALQNANQRMTDLANCIDSLDLSLFASVSSLHERMVSWMVQALLRLAPSGSNSSEEKDAKEDDKTTDALKEGVDKLFEDLDAFSRYLTT